MTIEDKFKELIQTVGGTNKILFDSMVEEVWPKVKEKIDSFNSISPVEINFNYTQENDYPDIIFFLYMDKIKEVVLEYLETNHPDAWFKPIYYSGDQLKKWKKDNNYTE